MTVQEAIAGARALSRAEQEAVLTAEGLAIKPGTTSAKQVETLAMSFAALKWYRENGGEVPARFAEGHESRVREYKALVGEPAPKPRAKRTRTKLP